ncbi:hypothetical protein A6A03_17725 [Chloroflexus islandicus]|uniref:Peptidase C14 caspase domain-containing protein n=1 Tax=Chloroflexus islandicus TaxID=1707952 RepID=A0A178M6E9_9CHLR|nr:ATP-binding protein [Chloroflexus islandicus]OAN43807.1 hypothetical protein A6A03_17725 [Chloroflexus islandicus]
MSAVPPHRHALIIGVDRAADPHLAPLASAERDASALAAALEAPACGFTVTLLLGPEATAQRIRREITALRKQAKQHPLDIIVAFCGHGVPVALDGGGNETFLATHDFTTDDAALDATAFLSLRWLYRQVYEAPEPRSAVLILDHCYAGNIRDAGNDRLMIDLRAAIEQYRAEQRSTPVPRDRLRAIFPATRPGERAGETDTGGLLTQAILTVLSDKTPVADGHVTINQLADYLKETFKKQRQQPYTLIEGNYSLTLADYRERIAAERVAAEQQRRRAEAQAMIKHWHSTNLRVAKLQADFVGREQELAAIQQHIEKLRPTGGYLLVTGVADQGKSSILARLANTTNPPIPAYFIRFTQSFEEQAALLGHLIAELLAQHDLIEEALTYLADNASPITLRNSLLALLDRLARERPLTLMIDGLDQIPVEGNLGQRDLSFLPERLPAGVVIVIGTRPDDTLVPLKLLTACREYPLPPLSLADFATLLDRRGVALSEADRVELHRKLHGNAFDLAFLAQELQREPNLADAQALIRRVIANRSDIFTLTIKRLKQEPLWESVIEPILGVLVAAQEPLSLPALASILGLKRYRVTDAITLLRGLLGERDREGQARYFLLHLKLIEYLRSELFPDNELAVFHHRLAHWCERDRDRLWQPANDQTEAERRAYAQTHLVYHLVYAQAYDRLWQLLDADEYGAAKRRADPSLRRYALDLDLARRAVVDAAGDDIAALARSLPRLWQYSLLRCSLTSQIDNWPVELFTALVALGRSAEARDRAELLSDPDRRAGVLLAIGHALLERGEQEEAVAVWRGARKVVDAISDVKKRTERLGKLATAFTKTRQFAEARQLADAIADDRDRAEALTTLAKALAQAGHTTEADATFTAARHAAGAIADDWHRAKALTTLAKALAQAGHTTEADATFTAARHAADAIAHPALRAEALTTLAKALAQAGKFTEARHTADTIADDAARATALTVLVTTLAQAGHTTEADATFTAARHAAGAIADDAARATALTALATALAQAGHAQESGDTFTAARHAADTIADDAARATAQTTLATALAQAGHAQEADATFAAARHAADAIADNAARAWALTTLAQALAQTGHVTEARHAAGAIADNAARAEALTTLAQALAQAGHAQEAGATFTAARRAADAIVDDWRRAWALTTLAKALAQAGQFTEARHAAGAIAHPALRAEALTTLAKALAQAGQTAEADATFTAARHAAGAIADDKERAAALRALAQTLTWTGQFTEARRAAGAIADDKERAAALRALAKDLAWPRQTAEADAVFAEARHAATAIADDKERAAALRALANALAWTRQTAEADAVFAEARHAATAITDNAARARALTELAQALAWPRHTAEADAVFAEARHAATAITDNAARARALTELAQALARTGHTAEADAVFAEARRAAGAIADDKERAAALRALANALAWTRQFTEARHTATAIADDKERAAALRALAKDLTWTRHTAEADAVFAEARHAADAIANNAARARALTTLAQALAQAGQFDEARHAADAIADTAARARALTTLAQALAQAGQTAEADATFTAARHAAGAIADTAAHARALTTLAQALINANRIAEAVPLLAEAWQQAQTRDELLGLFAVEAGLIRAYPEIGAGFVQAFAWVEEALRRGM